MVAVIINHFTISDRSNTRAAQKYMTGLVIKDLPAKKIGGSVTFCDGIERTYKLRGRRRAVFIHRLLRPPAISIIFIFRDGFKVILANSLLYFNQAVFGVVVEQFQLGADNLLALHIPVGVVRIMGGCSVA